MPIEVDLLESRFFSQGINGETFSSSTSDNTPNLVGNVGEKIKAEFDVKVYWYSFASRTNE